MTGRAPLNFHSVCQCQSSLHHIQTACTLNGLCGFRLGLMACSENGAKNQRVHGEGYFTTFTLQMSCLFMSGRSKCIHLLSEMSCSLFFFIINFSDRHMNQKCLGHIQSHLQMRGKEGVAHRRHIGLFVARRAAESYLFGSRCGQFFFRSHGPEVQAFSSFVWCLLSSYCSSCFFVVA